MRKPYDFYGSVTIGERGQIVIPAEARAEMGYTPGDKLLVMKHPVHEGLVICRIESIREFLDEFYVQIENAAAQTDDADGSSEPQHKQPKMGGTA